MPMNAGKHPSGLVRLVVMVAALNCLSPGPAGAQGVGVGDGDKLKGKAEADKGTVEVRSRYHHFCEILDKAAMAPGQEFKAGEEDRKKFKLGKLEFVGHSPWVAKLICEFIKGADPNPAKPEKKDVKVDPPAFNDYGTRRRFVALALDEIGRHTKTKTDAIQRERILVGDEIHHIRTTVIGGRSARVSSPLERRLDILRSQRDPAIMLIGLPKPYFEVKENEPIEWIIAGEKSVLGIYALAAAGESMGKKDFDEIGEEVGTDAEAAIAAFVAADHLKNATGPHFAEVIAGLKAAGPGQSKAEKERQEYLSRVRNKQRATLEEVKGQQGAITLEIVEASMPEPGLAKFVYRPLPALPLQKPGANPREKVPPPVANAPLGWYVRLLGAQAAGEAEGVTAPLNSQQALAPQVWHEVDVLYDETTEAPMTTAFGVRIFCIVRIVHHESPLGSMFPTHKIREHEERHFGIIREAWVASNAKVHQALLKLAQDINLQLGLAGDDAFRLEVERQTAAYKINQLPVNDAEEKRLYWGSIPQGLVSAPKHLVVWHSNPKYQRIIYRIVRKQLSPKRGKELHKVLTDKKSRDPKELDTHYEAAGKTWTSWLTTVFEPTQHEFERQFLAKGMEFDIEQGSIDHNSETPQPRPKLRGVLKQFGEATEGAGNVHKDPSEELSRIARGN